MESKSDELPEWANSLKPVRNLPTNNGSRIKKCVYDALEKCPPEWARKRLEDSISKKVYKGNASGPTKRAVLSVLDDVLGKQVHRYQEKPDIPLPDITLKLCRMVLRHTASLTDSFCMMFPRNLMDSSLSNSQRTPDSSASIFDHLDFKAIDCRLAVGTYGGSHEAFFHDVQELWDNVRTSLGEQPYMVQLADTFSLLFQLVYDKDVVDVVRKLNKFSESSFVSAEASKEVENILSSITEIPKAPWNSGVCKVCGIDKDDDLVLLCDICDGEYHTYCLENPLDKIPEEAWYCPSCISPESVAQATSNVSSVRVQLKEEESESPRDELVVCEVCDDRGSCDDMLSCFKCEISFVHRSCYFGERQVSAEDVVWACEGCEEV